MSHTIVMNQCETIPLKYSFLVVVMSGVAGVTLTAGGEVALIGDAERK
jgi:hypothetical protein